MHRDLKPENILIAGSVRLRARVMLCDFGLCARLPDGDAGLSDFVGSPGFYAPEVRRRRGVALCDGCGRLCPCVVWCPIERSRVESASRSRRRAGRRGGAAAAPRLDGAARGIVWERPNLVSPSPRCATAETRSRSD